MMKIKTIVFLHILLAVYACSGVLSKIAASKPFLSLQFCLCYGGIFLLLGIYAIGWQQIIKRMSLTAAFANKAVTVAWGLVYGVLFFREAVTPGKLIGIAMVILGVILFAFADEEGSHVE